jgi:hypothetical protein
MIQKAIIILIIIGTILLFGCAEPNDPESIYTSGGYTKVATHVTIAAAQDVVVGGNYAHVAQGEGGLMTIDIANPTNPIDISFITEDVRGYSRAIVKYADNVYLAASTFGFSSVNVADPANPVVTAQNIQMKPAREAVILNNWMFAALSEQGVQIAQVNETGFPDIRGKTAVQGYSNGVEVNSDMTLLFVATGELGLSVLDISEFEDGYGLYPTVGWINTIGYAQSVALVEDSHLALVASGAGGVVIIDYSDVENLSIVGTFHTDDDAYDVKVDNGLAYVTAEDGGFYVVNVNNPSSPVAVAHLQMSEALGLDFNDTHIFIADEEDGLVIIQKP